jgi:hypothetical protein
MFAKMFSQWHFQANAMVLVTLDQDDARLVEYQRLLVNHPWVGLNVIKPGGKIAAINDGISSLSWDICVLAQDDVSPAVGWADTIATAFIRHAPDTDAVLYSPDGYQKYGPDGLNTMPMIGRVYYNRFGYVYHPDYVSLWCDNEFTEVSRKLGKEIKHPEIILRHNWVGCNPDDLQRHNDSFWNKDMSTYNRRKREGFPR